MSRRWAKIAVIRAWLPNRLARPDRTEVQNKVVDHADRGDLVVPNIATPDRLSRLQADDMLGCDGPGWPAGK